MIDNAAYEIYSYLKSVFFQTHMCGCDTADWQSHIVTALYKG